jgi:hypothetical protein
MSLSASLRSLYGAAIGASAALNVPWLAALLIRPLLKTVKAANAANPLTVVILPKEGFTEDIMAALALADDLEVRTFPRTALHRIARHFLPYFIDENNYASCGPEFDKAKLRYRQFVLAMLRKLVRSQRIDAIVSGNFAYVADRELASACKEIGIRFIVLHKENLKTEGRVAFYQRVYAERRGPFTGHKVLVYNQIEHDLQIRAGVVESPNIETVGMPRLDRMHAWRRENSGTVAKNRILFFLFSSVTGMPRITRKASTPGEVYFEDKGDDSEEISLERLSDGSCRALLRLAQQNPDISIVVKSKGRLRDVNETAALFGVDSEAQLPPNLRIVHGGDAMPLIAEASVVAGFNSTALLEAVAAGKPIVMPWFAEAELPEVLPYVIDLRDIGVGASSPEAFQSELVRVARNPLPVLAELDPAKKRSLNIWTGNHDGQASARTRDAIMRELRSTYRNS